MTAVWLLPVVTLIVASSSGGLLALALQKYSPSHAVITVAVSLFMVAIGLSLALMMLTVYLLRLIIYGLPPGATIISVFLPLGPTGQAGYSILLIGQSFKSLIPLQYGNSDMLTSSATGEIINTICVSLAFVLWSLASMWMIFALLGVYDVLKQTRFPFRVPFWGLIFPNVSNLPIIFYSRNNYFPPFSNCRVYMPISQLPFHTHSIHLFSGCSAQFMRWPLSFFGSV
jgi:C4-dicarboxylate transporter/malic acid transport protein.